MALRDLNGMQIRNSLQVGFAGFLAAALFLHVGISADFDDGFYVVYGVARSLLPTPDQSLQAARARLTGTLFGGVIVVLVMQIGASWMAAGIGYVLIRLVGQWLRWSEATLNNAAVMAVLLLAVPDYEAMGMGYVLLRTGWHLIGLMIGMGVERLLWFQTPIERLRSAEEVLKQDLSAIVEGGTTASADGLILRHAELGVLRTAVRRSDAITAQESDAAQQRESCLEEALRHAVAMLRLPAGLRPLDAQACRAALRAWPG